ncbi:MAG: hypothetical protein ACYC6L_18045, partial [Anaerolineae bacterium]
MMRTIVRNLALLLIAALLLISSIEPVNAQEGNAAPAETAYLAIVDVYVTNRSGSSTAPPGSDYNYTGVTFWPTDGRPTCTAPYVPGSVGTWVTPSDINYGIGGDFVYIWVKYAWVGADDSTPVLTGISANHWPNWNVSCPAGYVAAHGDAGGALTTQSDSSCMRIGLCVQYKPMNETDTFISDVSLSRNSTDEATMPALCPANGNYWPMSQDEMDIHWGCGDGQWYFVVYNQAYKWPALPEAPAIPSDEDKAAMLRTYSPLIWQAEGESYYPSSVPWAFDHLNRVWYSGAWWLNTIESLSSPSGILDYFHGCNGTSTNSPCTLSDTPVYAFWDEVSITVTVGSGTVQAQAVDLVYFLYYPYNRGKSLLDTIWGNHVSDWEHVTVRMLPFWDGVGWTYKPAQIYLSAHNFGRSYPWRSFTRVMGDGALIPLVAKSGLASAAAVSISPQDIRFDPIRTHPVVYQAWGSHGIWRTAGSHTYKQTPAGDLTDYTSEGMAWKTWRLVETYNYENQAGLAGYTWPSWMGSDFTNPALGGNVPASGPIYRWGNSSWGTCAFGECQLNDGPTGPVDKGVW